MSKKKKIYMMITMDMELKERVQRVAKTKGLTPTSYTRSILIQELNREENKNRGQINVSPLKQSGKFGRL